MCIIFFSRKIPNINFSLQFRTGERPYVCVHCKKAFTQNGTLKRHYQTCKVAKRQAENGNYPRSTTPGPSWNRCPPLPSIPPVLSSSQNFIRPPLLPPPPPLPPNFLEQMLPRQQPNTNTPFPFEEVFKMIFESLLYQQHGQGCQIKHPVVNQRDCQGPQNDVVEVNDQPEVSDICITSRFGLYNIWGTDLCPICTY